MKKIFLAALLLLNVSVNGLISAQGWKPVRDRIRPIIVKSQGQILVPFCTESALSGDVVDVHYYVCPAMNAFEGKMINVLGEYSGLGMAIDEHLCQTTDVEGKVNVIMTYDREFITIDEQ